MASRPVAITPCSSEQLAKYWHSPRSRSNAPVLPKLQKVNKKYYKSTRRRRITTNQLYLREACFCSLNNFSSAELVCVSARTVMPIACPSEHQQRVGLQFGVIRVKFQCCEQNIADLPANRCSREPQRSSSSLRTEHPAPQLDCLNTSRICLLYTSPSPRDNR